MLKHQEELDAIRLKIVTNQTDWKKHEKDCVKVVYEEIQKEIVGKAKTLDLMSCGSCTGKLSSAVSSIRNYILFHEPKQSEKKVAKITMIVEEPINDIQNGSTDITEQLDGLTLSELRVKFPHIKSNSVKGFIEKLKGE